jgi:serpin B
MGMAAFKVQFVTVAAIAAAACATVQKSPAPPAQGTSMKPVAFKAAPPGDLARLAAANNDFGFDLFKQEFRRSQGKNVFLSPSSIAIALHMTLNGAAGRTADEMSAALRLSELSLAQVNAANADLWPALRTESDVYKFKVANALFLRQDAKVLPAFINTDQEYYGADVYSLDFADGASVQTINDWASKATEGRIPQIVQKLDPAAMLVLCNALYFKARWREEFWERRTANKPFIFLDKSRAETSMMFNSAEFEYFEDSELQAVSLPYKDSPFSMFVVLPRAVDGLPSVVGSLSAARWDAIRKGLSSRDGEVEMPKFKFDYSTELSGPLMSLGMKSPFDPASADFSKIVAPPPPLFITAVMHKTFIAVDEKGTEAAAVTAVELSAGAAPPEPKPPFKFLADHPFLFAIVDDRTGTIVFLGALLTPQE